jgi:predicted CoA-substrate-specific enzyme activase
MSCAHKLTSLGLDFGSRFVKIVYGSQADGMRRLRLDTLDFYRDYLIWKSPTSNPQFPTPKSQSPIFNSQLPTPNSQFPTPKIQWHKLGLAPPAALVATGYGKDLLKAHFPTITEIRANFLGACQQTRVTEFILLEMGGQDTKVLYIKNRRVFDFLTNDRCAAGTGRYLENMARFLKMPMRQFAAAWEDPVDISQTCAIFGESELIGYLLDGTPLPRLAAGVNASVARRALALVQRYPCRDLVFVGGVAQNRAVTHFLKTWGDYRVLAPPHPQFNGALGCYLEARKMLDN